MTRAQANGDVDPRPERVGRREEEEEEERVGDVGGNATQIMAQKRPEQLTLKRRRRKNGYREACRDRTDVR
jgi:hypothetical protein